MMGPIIEELAEDGDVTYAKVNVDEHKKEAGNYGVMSIPNFVVFKDGSKAGNIVGGMQKDQFKAKVDEILG